MANGDPWAMHDSPSGRRADPPHIDEATGLFNQCYYEERLFLLLTKARLNKTDVALALFSVEAPDELARQYGAAAAAETMTAVGRLIDANFSKRRGDFTARVGEGLFIVVCDGIPREALRDRTAALTRRINCLRISGCEDLRPDVCVGACFRSELDDPDGAALSALVRHRLALARWAGVNRIASAELSTDHCNRKEAEL